MDGTWWTPTWLLLSCVFPSSAFPGTDFFTAFPQNDAVGAHPDLRLLLSAHSDATAVQVTVPGGSFTATFTLHRGQTEHLSIPGASEAVSDRPSAKVFSIQSNKAISVVAVSSKRFTVGATAVLPVEMLGDLYYVVTPEGTEDEGLKEFLVVAGKAPTTVSIEVKGRISYRRRTYSTGSTIRIFLSAFHSVQLQSKRDLSGTKVTSDHAVAVLSGHTCVKMAAGCDYVVEQLLPVVAWGKAYVVPPIPWQKKKDFAYVAAAERTSVTYNVHGVVTTKELEEGEVLKVEMRGTSGLYVSSSAAIQVVFFFTGAKKGSHRHDPFLLTVPPISSFCSSYVVSSPKGFENHLTVVAREEDTSTITFNAKTDSSVSWQVIPGSGFSWATITVRNPEEIQSVEHHAAPIGVWVFGFQYYMGYGFSGLCATPSRPLSCQDLSCKEGCEMVDGQPKCLQEAFSTCWTMGGSHYQSFDGQPFHFMGSCTYTLVKSCPSDPTGSTTFNIEIQNQHKDISKTSSIASLVIEVYDVTIAAVRNENGIVRVNHLRSHLPISISQGRIQLEQNGRFLQVTTAFQLKVFYDWEDHAVVKLPKRFSGKVCGLCGDAKDETFTHGGPSTQEVLKWAQSWRTTTQSFACAESCGDECRRCQADEEAVVAFQEKTWCGFLTQPLGPLRRCHSAVDPTAYVKMCLYELCMAHGRRDALCRVLQAYADSCHHHGLNVEPWRTAAQCPLSCPEKSHPTPCATSCPPTCNSAVSSPSCSSSPCLESCQCHHGLVFTANRCVPKTQCGCFFEDLLHGPHEVFWGDTNCTKRCACDGTTQKVTCHRDGCPPGEECRVENHLRGCHPKSSGICSVVGLTHYETFDGEKFTFQGSCVYQLVGLCQKNPRLEDFQVLVKNGQRGEDLLSSIALVVVKVDNQTIAIGQEEPHRVRVNDRLVHLPFHQRDGKVFIYRSGREAVVETTFGVTVAYDWKSEVTVMVSNAFANALCGLCGNFNGDPSDEMMTKNGQRTSDPDLFGHSWKVTDIPGCVEMTSVECPLAPAVPQQQQKVTKMGCDLILLEDGPFRGCHSRVDANEYFQRCLRDVCLLPDGEDGMCAIISSFSAACQSAGGTVQRWRRDGFCDLPCPPNSRYEICSLGPSRTCGEVLTPSESSRRCREGCECLQGFALSGDLCVPTSQCGCVHGGLYYKAEETFSPTAEEKCHCGAGGNVTCGPSCPGGGGEEEEGEGQTIDGIFQCHPVKGGTCVATGDRTYVSFDGVIFNVTATCSYVLAETCEEEDNEEEEEVQPFVVTIHKEPRQKKKVSGIREVSVEVHGVTFSLRRDKRGEVMVDSISHHLPFLLNHGEVHVHRHGLGVLLQTAFGLKVRYDHVHRVTVTVPPLYGHRLCGLCGNYNGRKEDDLLLPGGHRDAVTFPSAWRTPEVPCDDHEECPEDICPVCTEEKKVVLHNPNYCGFMVAPEGPLSSCHHLVDPNPYLQACLHDLCLAEGDTRVLCRSIQSYVDACQDAGATIQAWRRPSFCPLRCPANSSYSICSNLCSRSCVGLQDSSSCPQGCVEGCPCDDGYVLEVNGCVPEAECGCFTDGQYFQLQEVVLKDQCHRRCRCDLSREVVCNDHRCTEDESCESPEGTMRCINQNPCKALRCRPKERCLVTDGQPRCVPSLVASCWAWGDPHYHSFDGLDFDFHGTCGYTMAETCGPDPTLVAFKVEAKNDLLGGVTTASYVATATVEVYGHRVSIHRREVGKVRVNGVSALLPVTLEDGKVHIFQSGLHAVVETDFGLRVTYDWRWHLLLDLSSSYFNQTCGLCGNFNLRPHDDVPHGGADLDALLPWVEKWKNFDDDDPFCWDHCEGHCPLCEEEKKELYGGNHYCGLLKKTFRGPFEACHEVVKPRDFYRNCLYDVCLHRGAKKIFCQVLETYASTCQKNGVLLHDWRTPAGCPLPCPEHSHYDPCGTACPPTCSDPEGPSICSQPCVETCSCDPGYVLSGGRCVEKIRCGCTHEGRYYHPGEAFWADEGCRKRCRCHQDLKMVVCHQDTCKPGQKCHLVKGVRRCVTTGRSTCVATGDPHYTTFDGFRYDFMGTCVYLLAALCSPHPTLVPFNVTAENHHRGGRSVSYTKEVTLAVYNMTFSLSQEHPKKVKVNGILVDLPFHHGDQVQVHLQGLHGFIKTDFEVQVTFDWWSYARVLLPSTYNGSVCGLCGNANGDPGDDLTLPDGLLANDEVHFADSWKTDDVPGCVSGCAESCRSCSDEEKRLYRGDKHCGLLVKRRGPLAACHGVLDPTPFFHDCLFDACVYKGHQETVCAVIAAYVTECQSRGVHLSPWRTSAFCPLLCPPNQHYDLCGPSCPPTCAGQAREDLCDRSTSCSEGCFCDVGFLRSGDRCVPLAQCGCLHEGRYYQKDQEFTSCPRCSQRCVCRSAGVVECHPSSCAHGEVCEVKDGVRGCHPEDCGRCQILAGGIYRGFDGHRGRLDGDCVATVAAVEARGSEDLLGSFVVEVEKKGDLIQRVVVTVQGVTIGMESGGRWEVTLDGERHLLPLTLSDGALTLTQEGVHRVLRTPGGLKLLYDGASFLLLTLPTTFRRRPRGLCGNFNGASEDETTQELEMTQTLRCNHTTTTSVTTACPPSDDPGRCRILVDPTGPFVGCHKVVDPQDYVLGCVRAQCGEEDHRSFCRSLQSYGAACQAAGGDLREWREVTQCPLSCPPHSHYELCGHTCVHTCASVSSPTRCPSKCFEGCQCDSGFLFDGDNCVAATACGCLHGGRYFQISASVFSSDCSRRCLCRAPGALHCLPFHCPFGQTCGLQDGVFSCLDHPGRCSFLPTSRVVSFDGATASTVATGVYVVATRCDADPTAWFRLLADVGEDHRDRPVVVALHLFTPRTFVTVKRDKKLWVNGVQTALPVEISDVWTVNETGGTIWITRSPEVVVVELNPTGEVTLTVTKDLTEVLCGICGNFDGDAANDLRGPDGKMVVDMEAVVKAWRAPDFTH
ncbi:IgGFc-binding protein-like [Cuculus canorus]|uniref:IgGFc-binding protein-like n=1 Tax=Cuculus canorus TaxID=55661 RepID=UPI0023AAF68C|nr:IgGFc-binding protein-like [Cuculus canorus]XP_053908649.1 IgGFc-binding protein-like [Cuculus canorus]